MTTSLPSTNGLSQQVYDTLRDDLRCDSVALHPKDSLRDDLGLNSLQTIELVYQVESVFDLQIPDVAFGRVGTIGDVVAYLLERTGSTHNHVSPPHLSTKAKKSSTNSTIKTKPRSRSKTSPP
jgi:acyl carrier protein